MVCGEVDYTLLDRRWMENAISEMTVNISVWQLCGSVLRAADRRVTNIIAKIDMKEADLIWLWCRMDEKV